MSSGFDRLGAEIQGRYRLEREIGRGGMARVFLARDLRHGRSVALKVLDPKLASEGVARFLREIEIASRLVHPHILGLLDSGEAAGLPYYVMPYVSGDSLRARLRREGELAIDVAVRIFREIADALAYAHGEGVVHRDVKPENVLFVGDHVQVADFGVAKALDAIGPEAGLTAAGLAVGTPAYMAPEQAAGDRDLDHRVDVYALGLLAYEMLSGAVPSNRSIEPLQRLRPNVPPALSALVMRCLEPRRADRWPSCDEVLRQLDLLTESGETETALWSARELEWASFRLMEETCRRLDRASFDPRMIGDSLQYLDNRARADILVACYPACGLDAEQFAPFLRATRYRALSLSPFGFEGHRKRRPSLSLNDHLVLARDWLRAMVAQTEPRLCLVVGFSSGADVALRLAAMEDKEGYPFLLDGCLALGCNLGLETCFVTRNLAALGSSDEEDTLAALRAVGAAPATLDDWIDVHDYLVQIARRFRGGLEPLQAFARDIVQPFEAGPLDAFVEWYRGASLQGRRLRCVFDDNAAYQRLIRDLHLRNLDEGILGERYEEDSILIEPDAGHFDLIEPGRIERHLDALVSRIGRRAR